MKPRVFKFGSYWMVKWYQSGGGLLAFVHWNRAVAFAHKVASW